MVHVLQTLQVLVGFAVKLEVGLEVGLVGTEFADKVASHQRQDLALARSRSVDGQMVAESLQRIGGEAVAHAAVIEMRRIGIGRLRRWIHAVR